MALAVVYFYPNMLVITLNVNRPNGSVKRERLSDCTKIFFKTVLQLQETLLKYKDADGLKIKEQEKIHANI